MQNFIFISPNFPTNYWQFCRELKNDGMNVLGIGDQPYDELKPELKDSLNEYYKVGSLENYDEVYRAVAFSTASSWASHKVNTNAGKSSEDGVWFGTSEPDDSKGALLYDTYVIEELKCDSNAGFKLIPAFEVVVSRNKVTVNLGTLTDEYEKEITIHTTATDKKTGEKMIVAGKDIKIVDKVTLDGLEVGTKYKLSGWQMLKEENAELLIDGKCVDSEEYEQLEQNARCAERTGFQPS